MVTDSILELKSQECEAGEANKCQREPWNSAPPSEWLERRRKGKQLNSLDFLTLWFFTQHILQALQNVQPEYAHCVKAASA